MVLLLGCGNDRTRKVRIGFDEVEGFEPSTLITLDINPACKPDFLHDLTKLPYPFPDNYFGEIHAYEVLEHTGQQGDWRFFFAQFSELWRILQPAGRLFITVPTPASIWAWGDPGHSRLIPKEAMVFLSQAEYKQQVGKTAMTDYRNVYQADFDTLNNDAHGDTQLLILQAVKPARI